MDDIIQFIIHDVETNYENKGHDYFSYNLGSDFEYSEINEDSFKEKIKERISPKLRDYLDIRCFLETIKSSPEVIVQIRIKRLEREVKLQWI